MSKPLGSHNAPVISGPSLARSQFAISTVRNGHREADDRGPVPLASSLGVGHLNPKVELAKVLLRRGMAVVIDVVDSPDAMGRLAARRVPERPLEEVQRGP